MWTSWWGHSMTFIIKPQKRPSGQFFCICCRTFLKGKMKQRSVDSFTLKFLQDNWRPRCLILLWSTFWIPTQSSRIICCEAVCGAEGELAPSHSELDFLVNWLRHWEESSRQSYLCARTVSCSWRCRINSLAADVDFQVQWTTSVCRHTEPVNRRRKATL